MSSVDSRVHTVIAMMNDHLHRKLSLTEMANSVALSPSRLRQLFRTQTGTSPVQYLRTLRMEQAKELLETTFLSVKEIAAKGGISSVSHFVTNFQRTYRRSPSEHRAASGRAARNRRKTRSHSRNGQ